MRRYLFIGGPWDGQWHAIPDERDTTVYRVPVMPDLSRATLLDVKEAPRRDALYYRQRAMVPGWRFPLTFYTTEPLRSIPTGTALPGAVQGMHPDAWHMISREPVTDPYTWADSLAMLHDAIRFHEMSRGWGR